MTGIGFGFKQGISFLENMIAIAMESVLEAEH